ncbi:MAG: 4-alpha-glucanotransferase [Melioribacteraceae bacterium]|nr:MAG: 4-alpha-glucanotransferase [Melioribacteraceae bacterium]
MKFERCAGILLHPTSLPGKYGIGDLGHEAYNFINFMEASGQTRWQVFPLGPTGYGDSPYQCFSAFAGNPNMVSPDFLHRDGLLNDEDIENVPEFDPHNIDFGPLIGYKAELLAKAYKIFAEKGMLDDKEYKSYCKKNKFWLDDFALFMAAKKYHDGVVWTDWSEDIALRKRGAVKKWNEKLADEINYQKFVQYIFDKQWNDVVDYAHSKGIKIIGDLPIFIAYDSADLWANKDQFTVDKKGKLEKVAGVPPDYFSKTGQLWGNPLYRWKKMEEDGFDWWINRFKKLFEMVDIVRIDHFRGFDAYWEIPGDAETAIDGRWVKAPGNKLFNRIKEVLGEPPIIAEDLGVITQSVVDLRDKFNFPGIKILQFAFGETGDKKFLPHRLVQNCVVHTGSHDNNTTKGFFDEEKANNSGIFEWTQKYLNYHGDNLTNELIRIAYASVADTCIIPMQDMLNLGAEARMNFPGKLGGNWTWRYTWDQVPDYLAGAYNEMCQFYQRGVEISDDLDDIKTHEE